MPHTEPSTNYDPAIDSYEYTVTIRASVMASDKHAAMESARKMMEDAQEGGSFFDFDISDAEKRVFL